MAKPRGKVKQILGELADLPAEAEEEARSVDELRAKVRDLETEARKAAKATPRVSDAEIGSIREEAKRLAQASADETVGEIQAEARELAKAVREVFDSLSLIADQADRLIERDVAIAPPPVVHRNGHIPTPVSAPRRRPAGRRLSPGEVDGPMQRILDAVAWLESAGIPGPYSKVQVAFLAKYSHKGGGFGNPLGRLRTAELIDYPSPGMIEMTAAGASVSNAPDRALTRDVLHERVKDIVDGPMWRILEPLLSAYPKSMTKTDLADAAGYSAAGGGFGNPLGRLRSLGLIDYPRSGDVVALDVLFP